MEQGRQRIRHALDENKGFNMMEIGILIVASLLGIAVFVAGVFRQNAWDLEKTKRIKLHE